jgi:sarcosine oxidase
MFKFGPLVGERVLGCLQGRQTSSDLSCWAEGY